MHLLRRIGAVGLVSTLAVVLTIVLNPTTVDAGQEDTIEQLLALLHSVGVPGSFGYDQLEFSANVIMFLPLGFFTGLLTLPRHWWIGTIALPAFSTAIEATQLLLLPGRFATWSDIVANSLGALVGIAVAQLLALKVTGTLRQQTRATSPRHRR